MREKEKEGEREEIETYRKRKMERGKRERGKRKMERKGLAISRAGRPFCSCRGWWELSSQPCGRQRWVATEILTCQTPSALRDPNQNWAVDLNRKQTEQNENMLAAHPHRPWLWLCAFIGPQEATGKARHSFCYPPFSVAPHPTATPH